MSMLTQIKVKKLKLGDKREAEHIGHVSKTLVANYSDRRIIPKLHQYFVKRIA